MPHKTEGSTIEKTRPTLRQRAKRIGALIMATAALSGLTVATASAEHSPGKPSRTEAVSAKLRNPQELPGLRIHLGRETLNKIKASTVEIVSRLKIDFGGSPDEKWLPAATAVKVSIPGQKEPYVMTVAHLFDSITGVYIGAFTDSQNPKYKAENFTDLSPYEYAVVDPNANLSDRLAQRVALIDRFSISTDDKDVALLHPIAVPISARASYSIRKFADIPAIPLKVAESAPIQGMPVALYGVPEANNFEPITISGVYLGRVFINDAPDNAPANKVGGFNKQATHRLIDLVGINPSEPQVDNCNFGTSGSMAMLPDGKLLGNLTLRTGKGYWGPDVQEHLRDSDDFYKWWVPIWENQLNVKLDGFSVICGYTVMDSNTPLDLVNGYKHFASSFEPIIQPTELF